MFRLIAFFLSFITLPLVVSCNGKGNSAVDEAKKRRQTQVQLSGEESFVEGDPVPSFLLPSLDELLSEEKNISKHSLLELSENAFVIVNFWATWCAPCVKELPSLQELADLLGDLGIKIVTVNLDPPASNKQVSSLVEKLSFKELVLRDSELLSVEQFRTSGFPETFFLYKGKLHAINDPLSGERVLRIKGDREWSAPEMVRAIKRELNHE